MTAGEPFSLRRSLRRWVFQFRAWFRSGALERELRDELSGVGDAALELAREAHTGLWFAALKLDVRHGLRQLRRSPGFAAVAILTLALGIGANLALLSLALAVLRPPDAYPHPEQLALVTGDFAGLGIHGVPLSVPELNDVRDAGGMGQVAGTWEINNNLGGGVSPRRIDCLGLSLEYFAMLGVKAELGRMPQAGDDRDVGARGVVVISDALWRGAFGASPAIIGRRLQLDGDGYTEFPQLRKLPQKS